MPQLDPLPPLVSPGLVLAVSRTRSTALPIPQPPTGPLPLAGIANTAPVPGLDSRSREPAAPGPALLQPGYLKERCRQWEARISGSTTPVAQATVMPDATLQVYRNPPLPPAATFALRRVEGAPSRTVDSTAPALPLLAAMAEHRAQHSDTFQWRPLLLAGMPYSPRRGELHPYGIQARLSGEAMGADEPPVIRHAPEVFATRVALHQFRQLLGAYAQITHIGNTTASPRGN